MRPIDRVIVKVNNKVYSFLDPLLLDETERPYCSNELIVSELFGRLYKLVRISKELYRDSIYKCFTIITLEQIEWPVPQDFLIL